MRDECGIGVQSRGRVEFLIALDMLLVYFSSIKFSFVLHLRRVSRLPPPAYRCPANGQEETTCQYSLTRLHPNGGDGGQQAALTSTIQDGFHD